MTVKDDLPRKVLYKELTQKPVYFNLNYSFKFEHSFLTFWWNENRQINTVKGCVKLIGCAYPNANTLVILRQQNNTAHATLSEKHKGLRSS